jgi:hypothetical protein
VFRKRVIEADLLERIPKDIDKILENKRVGRHSQ